MCAENLQSSGSEIIDRIRSAAVKNGWCVYSVCEIRNGVSRVVKIVPASNCHNCYSVAKAFVVTAIGILEDRGLLSAEEKVYPLFREKFRPGFDPKWQDVTIDHVLRHMAGFDQCGFLDIDCDNVREYPANDYLDMVLNHSLGHEPGTTFVYTDAAYYLLSRIVTVKCGERLDDFLCRELFNPMHFAEFAFSKCPHGYPMGATGLYISTEDMAKLGQLYLQDGIWEDRRILSEEFVQKALGRYELREAYGGYAKGGMYGQNLYLDPKRQLVIAFHCFKVPIEKMMELVAEN